MILDRCPGLTITDESRQLYQLFHLAHTEVSGPRPYFQRHLSFEEMMDLPNRMTEAFRVIDNEYRAMRTEHG